MSLEVVLHTAKTVRLMAIRQIEAINEELFDVQPPQFNNTIRWNIGHIISTMDGLVFRRILESTKLPEGFSDFFKGGTKPSDWTANPPSKSELISLLKQQLDDLTETFAHRLDEKLAAPFQIRDYNFETTAQLINLCMIHETMHTSTISNMLKVINYQNT